MAFQRRVVSALWLLFTAPASVLPQAPPIALRVVYPAAEDRVRVRDSSFLLGSVSGPEVRLRINGSRVRVADNGAWLAWLPFPPDSVMQFRIEAFRGQDSSVINYLVRRDPRFMPGEMRSGQAWIDTMSLTPRGQAWIGRDGSIQDLKLVRGSLLLGQAAYRAVKQWRYQPYVVNGRAVEAETFVTVDFRLP